MPGFFFALFSALTTVGRMADLPTLPAHPDDLPWPTERWPEASLSSNTDEDALTALLDLAFSNPDTMGETRAFLAVQNGAIVAERYNDGYTAGDTYPSWSKAKSITQALIGILVRGGKLDINAPADVPEWQGGDDPRREITLDQLLRMSSGLEWAEDYVDAGVSNVIEMLFGDGSEDVAAYAANRPLEHQPDAHWLYSSGTSNIVARIAARASGTSGDAFQKFMFNELFSRIGMRSPLPKFDAAGTFVGSSFCYCTARDFARFGYLYLRDGIWEGLRILPEGWVDYARTPTPQPEDCEDLGYGAHWWLGICGPGSFSANGYEGQFTIVIPQKDLVLVRHGKSLDEKGDEVKRWLAKIAECFPDLA